MNDAVLDAIKWLVESSGIPPIIWVASVFFVWTYAKVRERANVYGTKKRERIFRLVDWLSSCKEENKYILEQLFFDRYGKLVDYPIIRLLLNSSTPSTNISLYFYAGSYFVEGSSRIVLKKKYRGWRLSLYKWFYYVMYFVFAFLFCASLYAYYVKFQLFPLILLVSLCSIVISFISLEKAVGAADAPKLISNLAKDRYCLKR